MLLSKGVDALTEAGWGGAADDVLDEMIDDEESVVHVGRIWVERSAARSESSFERKLPAIARAGRHRSGSAVRRHRRPRQADDGQPVARLHRPSR